MRRLIPLALWAAVFPLTLAVLAYLVGFVQNRYTFNSIDSGVQIPPREAALVDLALLALFGVQHSVMARRWWKRMFPPPVERIVYLLVTDAVLVFLFYRWEPIPDLLWSTGVKPFLALQAVAAAIVIWAAVSQGALHFFGFHQAWAHAQGRRYEPPPFRAPGLYRYSRHPMMIGTLLFLWATPEMSWGKLLFAAVLSVYICAATFWEERDLDRDLGEPYRQYRARVRRFL